MEQWEYKYVSYCKEGQANELGKQGWQIIQIDSDYKVTIFQRPLNVRTERTTTAETVVARVHRAKMLAEGKAPKSRLTWA